MANWCRYCEGEYPRYWCKITNESIPWGIVERSCMNGGYGCSDYWISTYVGSILKISFYTDKTLLNMKKLKDNLKQDENYTNFIKMYDSLGPILADRLNSDEKRLSLSTKLYKYMSKVSIFVDKGQEDRAAHYYSKMVVSLVNKYNLDDLYNAEADFWNKANKDAKKVQKLTKTLEK